MKTMKKVAMILLALLLVLSTMSMGVSAVDETGFIDITISADKTENLYPGDIVTFTLNIKNNFNYTTMRWPVIYPSKAYEPVIVGETVAALGNAKAYGSLAGNDSTLETSEFNNELITGSYGGVSYSRANYRGLIIQWTGGTTSEGLAFYNQPNGANCITFQLRVLDGFAGIGSKKDGIAPVTIPQINNVKSLFYYQAIADPTDVTTLYKMNANTCPVTVTGVTTKIIKDPAAILPKAGTDVVIDERGSINYIYGFTEAANGDAAPLDPEVIGDYITTQGGATYTLEANEDEVYSTGAILHAFDAVGNSIGDYTVIIFGDVDGNGAIENADAVIVNDAAIGYYEWGYYEVGEDARVMACDVFGDDLLGEADFGIVEAHAQGLGRINQAHSADNPFFAY